MAEEKKRKLKTKVKSSQAISSEVDTQMNTILSGFVNSPSNSSMKLNIKKEAGRITKQDVTIVGTVSDEQKNAAKIIKADGLKSLDGVDDGYFKVNISSGIEIL